MLFFNTTIFHLRVSNCAALLLKKILGPLIFCNLCLAQKQEFNHKAQKLIGTFGIYHCRPIALTSKTANEVVDLFIRDIDTKGLILKASDLALLKESASDLFSQIQSNDDHFIKKTVAIYTRALTTFDSILTTLSKKKLNFHENDSSYFLPYSAGVYYSPTLKYHAKRVERFIKSKCYERVTNSDDYAELTESEFDRKAGAFSKPILIHFQKTAAVDIKSAYSFVESALLNAIALRYDPHSNYFNQEQNQEFNAQLSSHIASFGFYLDESDEGLAIIAQIEPGSSAWASNEINVGDIFVSVKIAGERITNEDLPAIGIQDKLDKTKENKITLTIKKQNGLVKTVPLIKQKTASPENNVKGYVLTDGHLKIGYISLPSFYTDLEERSEPGCAQDVIKEIHKMQRDSIQGLVMDLRNNGGGSVEEALNLAGIFIDQGPLFIVSEKNKKPVLVEDVVKGAIFSNYVLVMINEASASASELFSNIVKDYHLGLVVGQTSYGKGTAQSVLPLDTTLLYAEDENAIKNNPDFIKITHSKFYRLNGHSHQGNGIDPDILLPETPGYSIYKENKEPYYLPADSVIKKVVFHPKPAIRVDLLNAKSVQRVKNSPDFKRYARVSDSLFSFMNTTQKVALKFEDYKKFKGENDRLYNSYESVFESSSTQIECVNNSTDHLLDPGDEQAREFNAKILQSIQKDIFVNEAFLIFNDLIRQQTH